MSAWSPTDATRRATALYKICQAGRKARFICGQEEGAIFDPSNREGWQCARFGRNGAKPPRVRGYRHAQARTAEGRHKIWGQVCGGSRQLIHVNTGLLT